MSKQDQFTKYDQEHPEVYRYLLTLCRNVRERGFTRYAISPLVELVRWHFRIERGENEFKIQNDFKPWYARKIAQENPEFSDFFTFRPIRSN